MKGDSPEWADQSENVFNKKSQEYVICGPEELDGRKHTCSPRV